MRKKRGRRYEVRTLSSKWLGLGEKEEVYRRGPLVPVGDSNRD